MRCLAASLVIAVATVCLAGCGDSSPAGSRSARTRRADPPTIKALLRVARQFNDDYAANRDGLVYDRWDPRSRRIISRAEYIRRHRECPTAPGPANVQDAVHAGRWWLVHYSISGTELTDYWRYEHGRWVFDLIRSDPQAARLYRLPASRYVAAVGCPTHQ